MRKRFIISTFFETDFVKYKRIIGAPSINQVTKQSFFTNNQASEQKTVTKVKIM
jgi:hypothetical protein